VSTLYKVVYITYTMDLPYIYALAHEIYALALGLGHIYQANPSWLWYNYYIYSTAVLTTVSATQSNKL